MILKKIWGSSRFGFYLERERTLSFSKLKQRKLGHWANLGKARALGKFYNTAHLLQQMLKKIAFEIWSLITFTGFLLLSRRDNSS